MRHRAWPRRFFPICLTLLAVWSAAPAPPAYAGDLSEQLEPLAYRLGHWAAAVEFLDADGSVRRLVPGILEARAALDGEAIEIRGELAGTDTKVLSIVFVDRDSGRTTEAGVTSSGRFDLLHATVEDDRVIFTAEPRRHGDETVIFRAIDSAFEEDRYETTGWISTDGGETWRQTFRQTNVRADLFGD